MRLLHFRPDHVRGSADERAVRTERRRRERINERHYLPLRRAFQHRGCHSIGPPEKAKRELRKDSRCILSSLPVPQMYPAPLPSLLLLSQHNKEQRYVSSPLAPP